MALTSIQPPSTKLPPIKKIQASSIEDLTSAIAYLFLLYNPEIRGNRCIHRRACSLSSGGSTYVLHGEYPMTRRKSISAGDLPLDAIRNDTFERAYAIRWLTALVSRSGSLVEEEADWEPVLQDAASLLALCAGAASAGARSRVFAFPNQLSPELDDFRIQLTELPLDNQDYASVGAQTWGGACLLADMIVNYPEEFGLVPTDRKKLRILELGAGTGLVSLAVAKLLQSHPQPYPTDIIATDFHPVVLENLRNNIASNEHPTSSLVSVSAHFLDWSDFPSSSLEILPPFDEPFDVIYGADVVYELEHAKWIKTCVEALLRKPQSESFQSAVALSTTPNHAPADPRLYLVIPSRSTHAAESQTVEEIFPFAPAVRAGSDSPPDDISTLGRVLAIISKDVVLCEDTVWSGRRREVEYLQYTISWV
ncbi:hypothetical protein PHLCEN_2v4264 [Hermanssonia centrifuga]|uniref:S-adenosylmethionine-dependent methyltransferase n=1 Tax=Hermanssonia centrifuga TaxID=98765 RepID=A0A2R6PVM4_9APHY|nr:hypothetical protein PHLCEN_2v4264 [Hermanssonia centrifuga]